MAMSLSPVTRCVLRYCRLVRSLRGVCCAAVALALASCTAMLLRRTASTCTALVVALCVDGHALRASCAARMHLWSRRQPRSVDARLRMLLLPACVTSHL
jgi:hypothetical protein